MFNIDDDDNGLTLNILTASGHCGCPVTPVAPRQNSSRVDPAFAADAVLVNELAELGDAPLKSPGFGDLSSLAAPGILTANEADRRLIEDVTRKDYSGDDVLRAPEVIRGEQKELTANGIGAMLANDVLPPTPRCFG